MLALRFVAESVSLEAAEDDFTVEGRYTFERDEAGSASAQIDFPFLGGQADASSVRVFGAELIACDAERARFRLTFPNGATRATVRILYRQRLGSRQLAYLVTSALAWGAPIANASFSIRAPERWGAPQSSWPLPTATCEQARCAWRWSLRDFIPVKNLEVRWPREDSP